MTHLGSEAVAAPEPPEATIGQERPNMNVAHLESRRDTITTRRAHRPRPAVARPSSSAAAGSRSAAAMRRSGQVPDALGRNAGIKAIGLAVSRDQRSRRDDAAL